MLYSTFTRMAEAVLRLRTLSGNDEWRERLVLDQSQPHKVWVHAASVGELNSARPLIKALDEDPGVIVTTNSVTGRDMARNWGLAARLAPFDAPGATGRFLVAVEPQIQVTVEGEFWPNRSRMLAERGIRQVMIGARMSARSARRWARMQGLIGPMLARLAAVSAQDRASEERLLSLGLPPGVLCNRLDLKLLGPATNVCPIQTEMRDKTVLAASTHEGEDEMILDAWLAASNRRPDLRLILAPRHPRRADTVAALMKERRIAFSRRSDGGDESVKVLLADTLGEMARWYRVSGLCVTGGSLVDKGGHTPWEPAAYGCAILHGPHVSNFSDSYAELDRCGAAETVSAPDLGDAITRLVLEPQITGKMGQAARATLVGMAGQPDELIARIRSLAQQG